MPKKIKPKRSNKSSSYRYMQNDDGSWSRTTNDKMGRIFQGLKIRPAHRGGVNVKYIPEKYDNSEQATRSRDQWLLTHDPETGRITHEPGLEIVSPEFDILILGSGARANAATLSVWRNRKFANALKKEIDRGLDGATKDMPVFRPEDLYNPEHIISTTKYNPKLIGISSTIDNLIEEPISVVSQLTKQLPVQLTKTVLRLPNKTSDRPRARDSKKLALPEPKYGKYVDSKGNVNMRNVVIAVRKFYEKHPKARNYKAVFNYGNYDKNGNFIDKGNLYDHIRGVVKSAQEAPLPDGYTRLQFVQSALFHDIGKVLDPTKTHDKGSVKILKEMGIDVSPEVLTAIGRHMSSHLGNKDALSKALHFADVARGKPIEEAMRDYSYLGYPGMNKTNIKPLYKDDTQWQLKNIINPILERYGYYFTNAEYKKYGINYVEGDPPIPIDTNPDVARKMVLDKIKEHRGFVRSVYKANGHDWENLRKQTAWQTGKSIKDVTTKDMFENAVQYIKRKDTNSGTMGLDAYLKRYELNPKDYLALYASSRDRTAAGYRIGSNNKDGESYLLLMNINDNPEWSLAELWANNEFPIVYSSGSTKLGTDWRTYELPFRLNAGLDFNKEYKNVSEVAERHNAQLLQRADRKALNDVLNFVNKHPEVLDTGLKYHTNTNPTSYIEAQYPHLDYLYDMPHVSLWENTKPQSVSAALLNSRENLQAKVYGFRIPSAEREYRNGMMIEGILYATPSRIAKMNEILKNLGVKEVFPVMYSDVSTKHLIVKYPRAYQKLDDRVRQLSSLLSYKEVEGIPTIEKLAAYELRRRTGFLWLYNPTKLEIQEYISEHKDILTLLLALENISNLYRQGFITKAQVEAINHELARGKNMEEVYDKYIRPKQLAQRVINDYFSDIKKARRTDAFIRRKNLELRILAELLKKRENLYWMMYKLPELEKIMTKDELMKAYDVSPDYSYMSPDGYRVFSTERLDDPNPNDISGNHFVIVGPRGSKQLNIVGKWKPTVTSHSHGHGGEYIKGTSRNLGAGIISVTAGASTLKPKKKKKQ